MVYDGLVKKENAFPALMACQSDRYQPATTHPAPDFTMPFIIELVL
jgi:hypothetical protein